MPKTKFRGLQTLTTELVLTVLLIAAGAAILGFGIMYATNAKYHADLAYRHAAIDAYASLQDSQFTAMFRGLGDLKIEGVKVGYWHKDNTESDVVDVNCPPVRQIQLNSHTSFAGPSQYAGTVGYGYELRCNVGVGPYGPYNLTYVVVRDGDAVKVFRWRFVSVTPSGEVERQLAQQLQNQAQQLQQQLGQQAQLLASQLQQIQEQTMQQLAQYSQQLQQELSQNVQQALQQIQQAQQNSGQNGGMINNGGTSNSGSGNTNGGNNGGSTDTRTFTDEINRWMPDPRSTTTSVVTTPRTTWTPRYTTSTTSTPSPSTTYTAYMNLGGSDDDSSTSTISTQPPNGGDSTTTITSPSSSTPTTPIQTYDNSNSNSNTITIYAYEGSLGGYVTNVYVDGMYVEAGWGDLIYDLTWGQQPNYDPNTDSYYWTIDASQLQGINNGAWYDTYNNWNYPSNYYGDGSWQGGADYEWQQSASMWNQDYAPPEDDYLSYGYGSSSNSVNYSDGGSSSGSGNDYVDYDDNYTPIYVGNDTYMI